MGDNLKPVTQDDIPLQTFRKGSTTNAVQFRLENFYILIYCNRVTDKKLVVRYTEEYGVERPAARHEIKALGFRITIDEDEVKLFRYNKRPIEEGKERWAYSLRRDSHHPTMIYGLSLQVFVADPVNRIDFNAQTGMDAAFAVYRASLERAEFALREEIFRITKLAAREHRGEVAQNKYKEPPINPNKPDRTPVKTTVVKLVEAEKPKKRLVVFRKK